VLDSRIQLRSNIYFRDIDSKAENGVMLCMEHGEERERDRGRGSDRQRQSLVYFQEKSKTVQNLERNVKRYIDIK
jgi:hypothetical protein